MLQRCCCVWSDQNSTVFSFCKRFKWICLYLELLIGFPVVIVCVCVCVRVSVWDVNVIAERWREFHFWVLLIPLRAKKVSFLAQKGLGMWWFLLLEQSGRGSLHTCLCPIFPQLLLHHSKLISLLKLQQSSSFLHSILKLITVMSPLSKKKINLHCLTDLTNIVVQLRRKWKIITHWTLSLLFETSTKITVEIIETNPFFQRCSWRNS